MTKTTTQQVEVTIRLNLEMDLEADISTEVIAGLQVFADILASPVDILQIREEAEIYETNNGTPGMRRKLPEAAAVALSSVPNPMTTKTLTKADLRHFTGSEEWHRHSINRKVLFTDGAKHVADAGGAYWLLDEIALIQPYNRKVSAEELQVWKLAVRENRTATLTCENGNGAIVFTKEIPFTDFPLDEITLFFANNTIYLPSEH